MSPDAGGDGGMMGQRGTARGARWEITVGALAVAAMVAWAAPAGAASNSPTLGSKVLAKEIHAGGLGTGRPHRFNVGEFPAFAKLQWRHWGARIAIARGYSVPDGPFSPLRVNVRAYSLGACDGQGDVYRRIKVRYYAGHRWRKWQSLNALGVGASSRGIFCLDTALHHCTSVDATGVATPVIAYNLDCPTALRYLAGPLPASWTGANGDDSRGGHAWLFREADSATVFNAGEPNGELNFSQLGGVPAVYGAVKYGE
jgi:hypothetical protein